ncbi:REP-associated tyrosine transposase [Lutispora sp.]|uniref:REP-associated tyrosine transposase n=1 Tax=Lutispora sp. TaxID=2828727 RepID=UPI0035621C2C
MGRYAREEIAGGYYHVIARGNNREYIFNKDIDKGYFLKLLNESRQNMRFKLMGYVLMDNHYHLLMQTDDVKLQRIMHHINNKYSKYFNAVYERCGHVFQGRYKASVVQNEQYLLKVLAYIHQNPVKAGIVKRVEDYKWSSDKFYRRKSNGFIETSMIIEMIEEGYRKSNKKYDDIMNEMEETDYDTLKEIGDRAYEIMMKSSINTEKRPSLDEIMTEEVESKEIINKILNGSRESRYREYKLKYARKAQENGYTLREIGSTLGQSGVSIWKLLNNR